MTNHNEYQYSNITGAATTQVATGKGILHNITINTVNAAGTIKIIDGTSGTTANVGTITLANSNCVTLNYDTYFATGLRIVTSTSPDITISYVQG